MTAERPETFAATIAALTAVMDECAERDEFRNPRVAELAEVRRRVARERSQQLLVRSAPRKLLDIDMDAWMRLLVFGDELRDDFAFAAHCPESNGAGAVARAARTREQTRSDDESDAAAADRKSHAAIIARRP